MPLCMVKNLSSGTIKSFHARLSDVALIGTRASGVSITRSPGKRSVPGSSRRSQLCQWSFPGLSRFWTWQHLPVEIQKKQTLGRESSRMIMRGMTTRNQTNSAAFH